MNIVLVVLHKCEKVVFEINASTAPGFRYCVTLEGSKLYILDPSWKVMTYASGV